ncbi:hypothetical protein Misp04_45120 [Micromonospora sp. NBRC 101691]|nr:hypothetical protein Misp04_45120 [Micromonospora sp. NBRC 101691]
MAEGDTPVPHQDSVVSQSPPDEDERPPQGTDQPDRAVPQQDGQPPRAGTLVPGGTSGSRSSGRPTVPTRVALA